jgi:iron-sulfur cluster repair protein YtfE (RIC family)
MNCNDFMEPIVMDIVHEHRAIRHRLSELRALVQKPADESIRGQWLAAITRSLSCLDEQLRAHFAQEDDAGVMDEAVLRLPRLGNAMRELKQEHAELLRQVNEMNILAKSVESKEQWNMLRDAIEGFVNRMLRHEAAENKLLQQGFNQDFRALDESIPLAR